ncbi:hypothetical protein ACLKA7_017533 [Drosophila subpalustris]
MKFVICFLLLFIVLQLRISSNAASINFPLLRKSDSDKNHKKLNYTQFIPHYRLVPYVSLYYYRVMAIPGYLFNQKRRKEINEAHNIKEYDISF